MAFGTHYSMCRILGKRGIVRTANCTFFILSQIIHCSKVAMQMHIDITNRSDVSFCSRFVIVTEIIMCNCYIPGGPKWHSLFVRLNVIKY